MRFLISPTRDSVEGGRPPVRIFLGFAVVLLVAVFLQRATDGQLTSAGVRAHYLGGGEAAEVLPTAALLEELHLFAFLWGFLILMLGSLLVVSPIGARPRAWLTWGAAAACLLDLAAPFLLVRFPALAGVRPVAFVAAVGLLAVISGVVFRRFGRTTDA